MSTTSLLVRIFGVVSIAGAALFVLAGLISGELDALTLWLIAGSGVLSGLLLLAVSEGLDSLRRIVRNTTGADTPSAPAEAPGAGRPCPACGTENPAWARFCRACGAAMSEGAGI